MDTQTPTKTSNLHVWSVGLAAASVLVVIAGAPVMWLAVPLGATAIATGTVAIRRGNPAWQAIAGIALGAAASGVTLLIFWRVVVHWFG